MTDASYGRKAEDSICKSIDDADYYLCDKYLYPQVLPLAIEVGMKSLGQ